MDNRNENNAQNGDIVENENNVQNIHAEEIKGTAGWGQSESPVKESPVKESPVKEGPVTEGRPTEAPGSPDPPPGGGRPRPGLLDLTYGVLFDPLATFRRVSASPPLGSAVAIFTVVNIISALMGIWVTSRLMHPGYLGTAIGWFMQAMAPVVAVGGLLVQYIKWFIFSALLHLLAELFGGKGRAVSVFTVAGLASLPAIFLVPINLLLLLLGARGFVSTALTGIFSLAVMIWGMVLLVIGIREVHQFSTGRAFIVVITPLLAIILLGIIILVALAVGAASLPGGDYMNWSI